MRLTFAAAAIALAFGTPALADNATIQQTGVDNYASIDQENAGASTAFIRQVGDRNQAGSAASGEAAATHGIRQLDTASTSARIDQVGNDNTAWIDQETVTISSARVVQGEAAASHGNLGAIQQIALAASTGEVFQDVATGNTGMVSQTGSFHWGQVVQGGWRWTGFSWAFTGTPGVNNVATVTQSGERQVSRVNQLGSGNQGHSTQSGSWNEALILQEGGFNNASVIQTGTGAAAGERNIARITQTGTGHGASATQSGAGNTALINQH